MTPEEAVRSIVERLSRENRAELERACAALLAEGLPVAVVKQLIGAAAQEQFTRLELLGAQLERDVANAVGQPLTIH